MNVLKPFTCKVTGKRYEAGDNYEGTRGAELAAKGFVEAKEKVEVNHIPKNGEAIAPLNKLKDLIKEPEGEPTKKRTRKK
jgi:hypothetical protein